jgi:recombination protein RecA
LDAEGTLSLPMARAVGVDTDRLLVIRSTPDKILTGETYFEVIKMLIQQGIELIIVDSAPALVPSNKMEATIGVGQKATHANLMSEGLQQITPLLNGHKRTIVWFINQIRMKPMVQFGAPQGSTGGEALKFYASYSMEVYKEDDIVKKVPSVTGTYEERQIGVTVKLRLRKNKTATIPLDPITFDIYFEDVVDKDGVVYKTGVDTSKDMLDVAISTGIIKQSSSWFYYGDLKGNGKDQLMDQIKAAGPEMMEKLRKEVLGQ